MNATNVANDLTLRNDNKTECIQEIKWGGKREGAGCPIKFKVVEPAHRTAFTGDNEWYTPIKYIEAARVVLGEIGLDPATTEFGQDLPKRIFMANGEANGKRKQLDWEAIEREVRVPLSNIEFYSLVIPFFWPSHQFSSDRYRRGQRHPGSH